MRGEVWKTILRGQYAVSNKGRLKRLTPGRGARKVGMMRLYPQKTGYVGTTMYDGEKLLYVTVHRLVATKFIGPPPKGMQVNHIDGDKNNNWASNLEYVTPKENSQHAVKIGIARGRRSLGLKSLNYHRLRALGYYSGYK